MDAAYTSESNRNGHATRLLLEGVSGADYQQWLVTQMFLDLDINR